MKLTNSGEVAVFAQPLNQFQPSKSAYECVAFGCADINFCGAPGGQAGQADQIITLAEAWYAKLTGSNDASNADGMSTGQEYAMLNGLGLRYEALSGDLIEETHSALERGLPVLICGAESSFFDVGLGRVPYAWQPSGNHCIVASGQAGDDFLVRDYANSEFFGYCRQYSTAKMQLVSATAVYPHWMPAPEPTAPAAQLLQAAAYWSSTAHLFGGQALPYDTGIAKSWLAQYEAGKVWGPPVTGEISRDLAGNALTDWSGNQIIAQHFTGGRAEDHAGTIRWYGHP